MKAIDSERLRVLLVEDDEVDRMLVERSFGRSGVDVCLQQAADGEEALRVLRGEAGQTPLDPPYLVILDLNLPRMGGLEFLSELRSDPKLKHTVVFVLTTSDHEADRTACYDRGVAGYVLKQNLAGQSQTLARFLNEYWNLVQQSD